MFDDLIVCFQRHAEHLAELMIVRLDEERVILQYAPQEIFGRVDGDADAASVEVLHDALIDVVGQCVRNRACEDECIAALQPIEFFKQRALRLGWNLRPLPVDLRLALRLDLDVDARESLVEAYKVLRHAERAKLLLHRRACESREEAECRRVVSEIFQHDGDVDPLAPRQDLLIVHAVDLARRELLQSDDVVNRRIEGDRVDHIHIPPVP